MQCEILQPSRRSGARRSVALDASIVAGILVAMDAESPFIGRTLQHVFTDAAAYGYPAIVGCNATELADPEAVARTWSAIEEAHDRWSGVPTFVVDLGTVPEHETMGGLRRKLFTGVNEVCREELRVPARGGDTLVMMIDADTTGVSPLGSYLHRFVGHARHTGNSSLYYSPISMTLSKALPPNLRRVAAVEVRLLNEVRPFIGEGAMAIPLRVYNGTPGFRQRWSSSEGGEFAKENRLAFSRVPGTRLFTSGRRNEHALNGRHGDPYLLGFGPASPHRTDEGFVDLTEHEMRQLMTDVVCRHIDRCVKYFAAGGPAEFLYGLKTPEQRAHMRDHGAMVGAGILSDEGFVELAPIFSDGVRAIPVAQEMEMSVAVGRSLELPSKPTG
jgi:hypothetical protein